jgi:pyruvate-formate lyase
MSNANNFEPTTNNSSSAEQAPGESSDTWEILREKFNTLTGPSLYEIDLTWREKRERYDFLGRAIRLHMEQIAQNHEEIESVRQQLKELQPIAQKLGFIVEFSTPRKIPAIADAISWRFGLPHAEVMSQVLRELNCGRLVGDLTDYRKDVHLPAELPESEDTDS